MIRIQTFAEAQAIGVCIVAHLRGGPPRPASWDGFHSDQCGWCDYPQDVRVKALEAYTQGPLASRQRAAFFEEPRRERLRAIREAQGYES